MNRKFNLGFIAATVLAVLPGLSLAQSNSSGAPLGSKENPIKVTAVGTPVPNAKSGKKGAKRGSKANPITGQTHPRNSN